MGLVDRAKNICLTPKTEWPVIAGETTTTKSLMTGYVAPLAIIGPIAGFIGGSIIGHTLPFVGTYRTPLLAGIGIAIFTFVMAFVGVFILSLIIDALAPTFGGEKNKQQALKVAVYAYTPAWLAGILSIIPFLGLLAILAALYSLYLLYLGLPRLMKCPEDKSIGYTVVVVICAIVLSVVISMVGGMFAGAGMLASGALGSGSTSSSMQFDKDSPVGKLEQFGKKMEEAGVLSSAEARDAAAQSVQFVLSRPPKQLTGVEYAVDYVMEQMLARIGDVRGELTVETTLDVALQKRSQAILREYVLLEGESQDATQGAAVVLDMDGSVRALVGGRSYAESQYNRATKSRRQPGSAFKPFVFLAALESGLSPDSIMSDEQLTIHGWTPRNFSGAYRVDRIRQLLKAYGELTVVDTAGSLAFWQEIRMLTVFHGSKNPLWRISTSPRLGHAVVSAIARYMAVEAVYDWSGGLIWLEVPASADAGATDIRRVIALHGGHATLIRADANVRNAVEVFHPLDPGVERLSRRLKATFDPAGIFNPGRMYATM